MATKESPERARRRRLMNRRQSVRVATGAMRSVLRDVGPVAAHIKPRVIIKSGLQVAADPDLIAYASNPVTFATSSEGKLRAGTSGALSTLQVARHEVAHLIPHKQEGDPYTSESQIRVAGANWSTFGVKSAARLSRESVNSTMKRIARRRGKYGTAPK